MTRVFDAAMNAMWAMEEEALERLLTIAAREHTITDEALQAYQAKALANAERATVRDGVAIVNVEGPLFAKANLMTSISGATSYDMLLRDLTTAKESAKAIILNVNSPGGEVTNASELADAIFKMRGTIPIVAYVGGTGASAALWLLSAADYVVVSDTAMLGSLGVQATYRKEDEPKGSTSYTFVSSQSPMKNASPDTKAGAAAVQARVDALAQVFVEKVASYRGVDTQTALNNFGKGGIFVGKGAVEAGLADEVGNFEGLLAALARGQKFQRVSQRKQGTRMSETAETKPEAVVAAAPVAAAPPVVDVAAAVAAAVADSQKAERARISGLNEIAAGHQVDAAVLNAAIADGTDVAAFAIQAAKAAGEKRKAAGETAVAALVADEATVAEVGASGTKPVEGVTAEDLAAQIAAFAPRAPAAS